MRTGLAIDASLRGTSEKAMKHRERIIDLIRDLASEVHSTGDPKDHADQHAAFGFAVNGIETCLYPLCNESVAAIEDIETISRDFPTDTEVRRTGLGAN